MEPLLTLAEVAEALRTPDATLRFWRHRGIGPPSFKLGRRVVYRECDVKAYVEALVAGAGRSAA